MEKSIGALWIMSGDKDEYWKGNIEIDGEKHNVIVFKNSYKKDKQPDFKIYEARKKEKTEKTEAEKAFDEMFPIDLPF